MQLICEHNDIDAAIAELERAIPIAALQNVLEERKRRHKPTRLLRRRLELLRAIEIAETAE